MCGSPNPKDPLQSNEFSAERKRALRIFNQCDCGEGQTVLTHGLTNLSVSSSFALTSASHQNALQASQIQNAYQTALKKEKPLREALEANRRVIEKITQHKAPGCIWKSLQYPLVYRIFEHLNAIQINPALFTEDIPKKVFDGIIFYKGTQIHIENTLRQREHELQKEKARKESSKRNLKSRSPMRR